MGHVSIVTTMRYLHATDQGKRGENTVLSKYRQQRRRKDGHKLVTTEKRQAQYSLEPAAIIENNGEPWRARTSDPLIKSQLLYQLS